MDVRLTKTVSVRETKRSSCGIRCETIYQFSIQRCSRHTSCEACVTTPNLLCGWCSAEGRCGTTMDCPTSGQPNHYVSHGNNSTCPVITMVTPCTIDVQNISNVMIILATRHVPQDGGINYECRYVFDRNGDEFRRPTTGLGGGDYLCISPPQDRLREIITAYTGEASPRLQLVRYLTTEPSIIVETNHVTYFDCQSYTSCVPCVSQSTCQWCAESATCGAKGGSCSSPYTESTKHFCPQITPSGTAKYTLFAHVNETKALSVPVSFRDDTIQVSTDYRCVFMRDGSEEVVAGTLNTTGTESGGVVSGYINCDYQNFGSRPAELEVQIRFSLQDNRECTLDNPNMIRVHVYDCGSSDIRDCSECVTLPGELDCGYCRENQKCSFTPQSSCNSSRSLLRTSSISCPVNVTDFTPRGGPTEGGTTITITGFNLPLGTTDVDSITIGSAQCDILQSNFQPAEKLTCTTGQTPVMSSPITISFTDGSNTLRTIQTAMSYSFVDVTLTSVEPSSGIASGGTVLTLTGPSLIYGSRHKVELELETGTKLPCSINEEYRQPGSLQCTTPNHGQVAGDIDVLVTIDNQNTKLKNGFSYEDDPEIASVSPNRSFTLGGIPFRVIGRGFDIVQNPQLIFRFTPATAKREALQGPPPEVTSQCRVATNTLLECPSPGTGATPPSTPVAVVITMDGLTVSDVGTNVTIFPNPTFEPIGDARQTINNYEDITIKASIMMPDFARQYLMVTIGNSPLCKITSLTTTEVVCRPDNITDKMAGIQNNVMVKLGNQETLVGRITFEQEFQYILYIVLPVLAVILFFAVLLLITASFICQRRVKKNRRHVDQLEEELYQMESTVVENVKAERELNLKKHELEQQVENMASQVTMVYSQMKELVEGKGASASSRSGIKRSQEQYEEVEQVDGYEAIEDIEEYEEVEEELEVDGYEEVKEDLEVDGYEEVKEEVEVDGYEEMAEIEVDGYEVMEEVEVDGYEEVKEELEVDGYEEMVEIEVDGYEVMEEVEVDGYAEVKEELEVEEYEEVKEVDGYEVMDGDEAEASTKPEVQKDKNDPEEYMDMSGNDTLPPPVVTSQEPPNQTIQQTPSDGKCEVRTSDVDGSHTYTNVDPDPSINDQMTKNPAYDLPPVGMLPPDHVNHEGT